MCLLGGGVSDDLPLWGMCFFNKEPGFSDILCLTFLCFNLFCHPWKFLLIFMDIYGFHLFLWTPLLTRGLASDQEQETLMD